MNVDELAFAINEKSSLIESVEDGTKIPSVELQRKLEQFLGIDLSRRETTDQQTAS